MRTPTSLETYVPHRPWPTQWAFLELMEEEAFYGGAAAGGKSEALLMAALAYVDIPGYAALILRRDLPRLNLPGGLIPRSHEWLRGKAKWNGEAHRWHFPKGATLTFGYLQQPSDRFRYGSSEFQYIAFDELTEFSEEEYLFLFSRLRRTRDIPVPLRMRSASNPGNVGHEWVKRRFIRSLSCQLEQSCEQAGSSLYGEGQSTEQAGSSLYGEGQSTEQAGSSLYEKEAGEQGRGGAGEKNATSPSPPLPSSSAPLLSIAGEPLILWNHSRAFVPARIADNPAVDEAEYRRTLAHLPAVERERLMNGDWNVRAEALVRRSWLRYYEVRGRMLELGVLGEGETGKGKWETGGDSSVSRFPNPVSPAFPVSRVPSPESRHIDERFCRRFVTIDPAGTSQDRADEQRGRPRSWSVVQVWDMVLGEGETGKGKWETGGLGETGKGKWETGGLGETGKGKRETGENPESPTSSVSRFPYPGSLLILRDVRRERVGFDGLCRMLRETYARWRPAKMLIEREKLGQAAVDVLSRELPLETVSTLGRDKVSRAGPLIIKLERGEVWLPREASWLADFESELLSWTGHPHETSDQVDAAAYAALEAQQFWGPVRVEGVWSPKHAA